MATSMYCSAQYAVVEECDLIKQVDDVEIALLTVHPQDNVGNFINNESYLLSGVSLERSGGSIKGEMKQSEYTMAEQLIKPKLFRF
jgi:hypothetical protein